MEAHRQYSQPVKAGQCVIVLPGEAWMLTGTARGALGPGRVLVCVVHRGLEYARGVKVRVGGRRGSLGPSGEPEREVAWASCFSPR